MALTQLLRWAQEQRVAVLSLASFLWFQTQEDARLRIVSRAELQKMAEASEV